MVLVEYAATVYPLFCSLFFIGSFFCTDYCRQLRPGCSSSPSSRFISRRGCIGSCRRLIYLPCLLDRSDRYHTVPTMLGPERTYIFSIPPSLYRSIDRTDTHTHTNALDLSLFPFLSSFCLIRPRRPFSICIFAHAYIDRLDGRDGGMGWGVPQS